MKRLIALLLAVLLAASRAGCALGEDDNAHYRYEIDLLFEMEEQEYTPRIREHMRGYEELLNALELKATVLYAPEIYGFRYDSFDVNLEIIPRTDPSAEIAVRLFGRPSTVCIQSPLLGPEPFFLGNTNMIMSFAKQFRVMTGVPLTSLGLLNPFLAEYATYTEAEAWRSAAPEIRDGTVITAAQLRAAAEAWREQLKTDEDLLLWLDGFHGLAEDSELLARMLDTLPDTLVNAAGGEDLAVAEEDGVLVCRNARGEAVFRMKDGADGSFFELAPEDTGAEYLPYVYYETGTRDGKGTLALKVSWDRKGAEEAEEEEPLPDSMLRLGLEITGIPETFPGETAMAVNVSTGGSALPEAEFRAELEMKADGETELRILKPGADGEMLPVFRAYGTVKETEYDPDRDGFLLFEYNALSAWPHLLIANYKSIGELGQSIAPEFAANVLDFVYALPVKACQSIMDDLEESGVLEPLLEGMR